MAGIARLFNQTVTVETYLGTGVKGPTFAAPASVLCFVDDSRKLVRDSTGEQVVSSTTVYAPLSVYAQFPVDSKVTVNGRTARVVAVELQNSAGPASVHHTQVNLT